MSGFIRKKVVDMHEFRWHRASGEQAFYFMTLPIKETYKIFVRYTEKPVTVGGPIAHQLLSIIRRSNPNYYMNLLIYKDFDKIVNGYIAKYLGMRH